jgi:hypothetical protein
MGAVNSSTVTLSNIGMAGKGNAVVVPTTPNKKAGGGHSSMGTSAVTAAPSNLLKKPTAGSSIAIAASGKTNKVS